MRTHVRLWRLVPATQNRWREFDAKSGWTRTGLPRTVRPSLRRCTRQAGARREEFERARGLAGPAAHAHSCRKSRTGFHRMRSP